MTQVYVDRSKPNDYPLDEEKSKIAEYIYNEYEEIRKDRGDLELDLLNSVNVNTASGRFDMVFLATLFSGWAMKEERARARSSPWGSESSCLGPAYYLVLMGV